jgi:flagellar transcriptional activator FlhD
MIDWSQQMTTTPDFLVEIRQANLAYLMLAQRLIRADRTQALFRLGLSEGSTDLIAMLTPAQVMRLADSPQMLCSLRIDDDMVWQLLTNHGKTTCDNVTRLHANILLAGRHEEASKARTPITLGLFSAE